MAMKWKSARRCFASGPDGPEIALGTPAPPVNRAPRGTSSIAPAFARRDRAALALHRGGHGAAVLALARAHSDPAGSDADGEIAVMIATIAVPIPVVIRSDLHVNLRQLHAFGSRELLSSNRRS